MDTHKEQYVIDLWTQHGIDESLGYKGLSLALQQVVSSCNSTRLAEYLIQAGADVNHRSRGYPTAPLEQLVRRDRAESARLIKLFLEYGAIPKGQLGTSSFENEKGPRNISKWLGISWDELLVQTEKAREQRNADRGPVSLETGSQAEESDSDAETLTINGVAVSPKASPASLLRTAWETGPGSNSEKDSR
ncbi:hypothetical protein MMC25_000979 [Agyrium rufum]|nr:hypothetical protein [Agyrium rufum]